MASESCGNPATDTDATMPRRPKFDRSKFCVKCKENTGNIVIRHAVYCKNCFMPLLTGKIRRNLEPFINEKGDGSRRRYLKASGNLLIGISGGLGSTVLLDLISRMYFPSQMESQKRTELLKGGTAHPRNEMVWQKAVVCYVEVCSAFPNMKDRTEDVRTLVKTYEQFEFTPLRLEDAFDRKWWAEVGGKPSPDLFVDPTNEALFLTQHDEDSSSSPVERLRSYLSALPTPTAIPSAIRMLVRLLLLYTAQSTNSSHLLLGANLTSLSISLISSISQGGGFTVKEEAQEEWTPKVAGNTPQTVRLLRPLQEIGLKECAFWAWWNELNVIGRDKFPGAKQGIGALTRDFIVGLERDYPSTVSTVARTCGKLAPKAGANGTCVLCDRSLQIGVQEWKARISIRSLSNSAPPPKTMNAALSDTLCYSCHTTLTSRSSKVRSLSNNLLPLPVWVHSYLKRSGLPEDSVDIAVQEELKESGGEIWERRKIDRSEMKGAISEFLLEE
ncbi:hypothetical protein K435DRAFT_825628 [Dendrothele bispora CBS 962.96]|uniref:Cytoplasmic tRNA 2-thiolation protein 2 n=1 Tax=Dendrothele bispora (strain CBS 962.96) TaxID=1314807 RepID=A0A4S8MW63_DENBC|nr:hypothetical protein K435DRAFT_825628 [Dendrothele bispora CBS 962.96]